MRVMSTFRWLHLHYIRWLSTNQMCRNSKRFMQSKTWCASKIVKVVTTVKIIKDKLHLKIVKRMMTYQNMQLDQLAQNVHTVAKLIIIEFIVVALSWLQLKIFRESKLQVNSNLWKLFLCLTWRLLFTRETVWCLRMYSHLCNIRAHRIIFIKTVKALLVVAARITLCTLMTDRETWIIKIIDRVQLVTAQQWVIYLD